jgi:hypothetical protein
MCCIRAHARGKLLHQKPSLPMAQTHGSHALSFFYPVYPLQGADRLQEMEADKAKSLSGVLAGREAVTLIVDDNRGVWADHVHNLVAVERYIYFPSSRIQLGIRGPSLLELDRCAIRVRLKHVKLEGEHIHSDGGVPKGLVGMRDPSACLHVFFPSC